MVESATLRLYADSAASGRTLQAIRLAGSWSENGVTWSNQPATTGAAATANSGSGWREWNVATQVQATFDTGANYGFLIHDASESGSGYEQQFHGREKGESTAQLIITFAAGGAADTTPPETTIDSGPEVTTTNTAATFAFAAGEPVSTFECSLDGAPFAACVSPYEILGVAAGAHDFSVRAIDLAGNVDPTPASWSWTVEVAPPPPDCGPAITLTASADAWIDQNSASSNFGDDSARREYGHGPAKRAEPLYEVSQEAAYLQIQLPQTRQPADHRS